MNLVARFPTPVDPTVPESIRRAREKVEVFLAEHDPHNYGFTLEIQPVEVQQRLYLICKGGPEFDRWLSPDGRWITNYTKAGRWTQDAADELMRQMGITDYGLYL
jgi:hypothetical protein